MNASQRPLGVQTWSFDGGCSMSELPPKADFPILELLPPPTLSGRRLAASRCDPSPISADASMHSSHGTFCGNSACTALESEFLVASGDIGHLELNWLAATGRKPRFVIGHGEDFTVSTNKNMNVRTDTLNRVFGNAAAKHFWPHP
jgi:hypothetical protein